MNGQTLLNRTLKVNAAFSLLSGLDFVLFDKSIGTLISNSDFQSLAPTGFMLIGFAVFVFVVSTLKRVYKYLVAVIISMDVLWVVGSLILVSTSAALLTSLGLILILIVAAIIGLFAYLQARGLVIHLRDQTV